MACCALPLPQHPAVTEGAEAMSRDKDAGGNFPRGASGLSPTGAQTQASRPQRHSRPPPAGNNPAAATAPPCHPAGLLPPACGARPALLLSRPRPLHQYACRAAPCRPGFGVGPGPAHPPAPGGRHGAAWAPRAHRATRRRKRRQTGAMAPHTRTMLPPPPLQLQPVLLSGPVRSSACGLAQRHNGVSGRHGPALHHQEVL